jgi:cyclophilin family peptidyl-prolyl cis-trans isomerase
MRSARRQAFLEAVRRRRRRRLTLLAASVVLIGGGLGIAFLARGGSDERPQTTRKPEAAAGLEAPTPEPVACGAKLPKAAASRKKSFARPKDQHLDPAKEYALRLKTSCGEIDIALDVEHFPKTVNSVVFLAREGFYDGLVFHRNVPGFVIQGGDPTGNGSGGPGYSVTEQVPKGFQYEDGAMAMAKTGQEPSGTSGSQFFIVAKDGGKALTPDYAVAGKVVEGMKVVDKILDVAPGNPPSRWVYIERATVTEE